MKATNRPKRWVDVWSICLGQNMGVKRKGRDALDGTVTGMRIKKNGDVYVTVKLDDSVGENPGYSMGVEEE